MKRFAVGFSVMTLAAIAAVSLLGVDVTSTGGGGSLSSLGITATAGQINGVATSGAIYTVESLGVVGDGTDQLAHLTAAEAAMQNGGTVNGVVVPAGGGTLVWGQSAANNYVLSASFVHPYVTALVGGTKPVAYPIRWVGAGSYADGSWSGAAPKGGTVIKSNATTGTAKFVHLACGFFSAEHITFLSGDATNGIPFVQTTSTTIDYEKCAFIGGSAGNGASNEDVFVMGGTNTSEIQHIDPNDAFQGYGSRVIDCWFDKIRRGGYSRGFGNGIRWQHNTFTASCGFYAATGTPATIGATTLTVSGTPWTAHQWIGYAVAVVGTGTNNGARAIITENTTSGLTIAAWQGGTPVTTNNTYIIGGPAFEADGGASYATGNIYDGNLFEMEFYGVGIFLNKANQCLAIGNDTYDAISGGPATASVVVGPSCNVPNTVIESLVLSGSGVPATLSYTSDLAGTATVISAYAGKTVFNGFTIPPGYTFSTGATANLQSTTSAVCGVTNNDATVWFAGTGTASGSQTGKLAFLVGGDNSFDLRTYYSNGTTNKITLSPGNSTNLVVGQNLALHLNAAKVPTSSAGLVSGDVWMDTTAGLNSLKMVP